MSERLTPCPVCRDCTQVYVTPSGHPHDPYGDLIEGWLIGQCQGCQEREANAPQEEDE